MIIPENATSKKPVIVKVGLPPKNSTWGVHTNPIAGNRYKHVYNADNLTDKIAFVEQELLDGQKIDDFLKDKEVKAWTRTQGLPISFRIDTSNYPNPDNWEFFLNKDIAILYKDDPDDPVKYYFYALKNGKKVGKNIYQYDGELDVFFTYAHLDILKSEVYVEQGHYDYLDNNSKIAFSKINSPLYSNEDMDNLVLNPYSETFPFDCNNARIFDENKKQIPITDKWKKLINQIVSQAKIRLVFMSGNVVEIYNASNTSNQDFIWKNNIPPNYVKNDNSGYGNYSIFLSAKIEWNQIDFKNIFDYNLNLEAEYINFTTKNELEAGVEDIYEAINVLVEQDFKNDDKSNMDAITTKTLIPSGSYEIPAYLFLGTTNLNKRDKNTALWENFKFNPFKLIPQINYNSIHKTIQFNFYIEQITNFLTPSKNGDNFVTTIQMLGNKINDSKIWNGNNYLVWKAPLKNLNLLDKFKIDLPYKNYNSNPYVNNLLNEPKILIQPYTKLTLQSNYGTFDYDLKFLLWKNDLDIYNPQLQFWSSLNLNVKNKAYYLFLQSQYYADFAVQEVKQGLLSDKKYFYVINNNVYHYWVSNHNFKAEAQNYLPSYQSAYTDFLVNDFNQYHNSLEQAELAKKRAEFHASLGFLGGLFGGFAGGAKKGGLLGGLVGGAVGGTLGGVGGAFGVEQADLQLQHVKAEAKDKKNSPPTIQPSTSNEYNVSLIGNFSEKAFIYSVFGNTKLKLLTYWNKYGYKWNYMVPWDKQKLIQSRYWWNYLKIDNCFENIKLQVNNETKKIIAESFADGITFWNIRRNIQNKIEYLQIKDYSKNNPIYRY